MELGLQLRFMFDEEGSKIWRHAGVIWSTDYMYKVDTLSLFW
jgi:hypothetical protein